MRVIEEYSKSDDFLYHVQLTKQFFRLTGLE